MVSPVPRAPSLSSFTGQPFQLVEQLLSEQQSLTAVERFSARESEKGAPDSERYYRDLLPLRDPAPGEQFAFEVDLDRCSGCKACVTACHSLNGLDEGETWRHVGLIHQPEGRPVQQHVTTACHHCAEPACAQGCPVLAYEKDPVTGVVRHLDDQCFGCQYCILKCPYDVPQYNEKKGIVRKCDMCVGRLREGEAPACVQACPTRAIRITLVDLESLRRDPAAVFDVPGAPDPRETLPATRYVSKEAPAKSLVAVDAHRVRAEHPHWALIFMLTASQAMAGYWMLYACMSPDRDPRAFPWPEIFGFAGASCAVGLSLFHLGRPRLAWKAFLGWRRSWLSREVIAFSAWTSACGICMGAAASARFGFSLPGSIRVSARVAAGILAWAAVYASAMVYRDTPRLLWATRRTLWRFTATALLCGIPLYALFGSPPENFSRGLLLLLAPLLFGKLALEARVLRHRDDEDYNPLWKASRLLLGPLGTLWRIRVTAGLLGGACLAPLCAIRALPGPQAAWIGSVCLLLASGELMERYLFFVTAVSPRMPGGR